MVVIGRVKSIRRRATEDASSAVSMIVSAIEAGSTGFAFEASLIRRSSALLTIALKALMTLWPTAEPSWPRSFRALGAISGSIGRMSALRCHESRLGRGRAGGPGPSTNDPRLDPIGVILDVAALAEFGHQDQDL